MLLSGATLKQTDGRTDMAKLEGGIFYYTNTSKTVAYYR
jgi:hypothetical protein